MCVTFNRGKTDIVIQSALITLDHKQPATPLKINNYITDFFVNSGMKQKRSKKWYIKCHWLRDNEVLDQLIVYCDRGTKNDANYFTKHHPPIHHRKIRPRYIHTSSLVRKITQTIILYKCVLNRVPFTHSCINCLKTIRA